MTTKLSVIKPPALAEVQHQLDAAVDRLHDVDAALAVFVQKCHEDDVTIDLDDGTGISAARPIAVAMRELEALRAQIAGLSRAVEMHVDAARGEKTERLGMNVQLVEHRQFVIDADDRGLYVVEPRHDGASEMRSIGSVSREVFGKIARRARRAAKAG